MKAKSRKQQKTKSFVQQVFLSALAAGASIAGAARASGRARSTFYTWRRQDKSFASAWADAVETGTDLLEDEAMRRAILGVTKPVFYGGKVIGEERRHSDQLLVMLLKARRPNKFDSTVGDDGAMPDTVIKEDASTFQKRIAELIARQNLTLAADPSSEKQTILHPDQPMEKPDGARS